jgi:hypothetical protein
MLWILVCLLCVKAISASYESVKYETLYFYYAYKMEFLVTAGDATEEQNRKIAKRAAVGDWRDERGARKFGERLATYDEFMSAIILDKSQYKKNQFTAANPFSPVVDDAINMQAKSGFQKMIDYGALYDGLAGQSLHSGKKGTPFQVLYEKMQNRLGEIRKRALEQGFLELVRDADGKVVGEKAIEKDVKPTPDPSAPSRRYNVVKDLERCRQGVYLGEAARKKENMGFALIELDKWAARTPLKHFEKRQTSLAYDGHAIRFDAPLLEPTLVKARAKGVSEKSVRDEWDRVLKLRPGSTGQAHTIGTHVVQVISAQRARKDLQGFDCYK